MRIGNIKIRVHSINELEHARQRKTHWFYRRYFFYVIKLIKGDTFADSRELWDGHLEVAFRKPTHLGGDWFSSRFHIGNRGSETPWDGHLAILGMAFYWGHTGFRGLADRLTRCDGYQYDTREWSLKIFDHRLWWEIANHDDMCKKHRVAWGRVTVVHNPSGKKPRRPRRTIQAGSINISIPELIWGPKRYTYETVDSFATMIKLAEDEYPVLLDLRKSYVGRTKVPKEKHEQGWELEVEAPSGIPTHVDHSGGWKGDRTYGWGIRLDLGIDEEYWKDIAPQIVRMWVENERRRTGFVKPDPVESDG